MPCVSIKLSYKLLLPGPSTCRKVLSQKYSEIRLNIYWSKKLICFHRYIVKGLFKEANIVVQHHLTQSDETCWPCLNTMSEDVGLSFNLLKIFAQYRATLLDQQCGPMLASFEQVLTPTKNSLTRVGFELAPMYI